MLRIDVKFEPKLPDIITRENWGDLMTDVHLWQPVIRDICSAIDLDPGTVLSPGYPGSCAVFVVDKKAVIKIFPSLFAGDFAIELAAYECLHGEVEAIPSLLASGIYCDRIEWPFLVLKFSQGEPIRTLHVGLAVAEKRLIANQVGQVLRRVHQTTVERQEPFSPWPDFLHQRFPECLREIGETMLLPEALLSEIELFLTQMMPELEQEPAVLVNADLTDDHVLLIREDGRWRLSVIIDWADAEIAPSTYEWIAAWFGFCRMDAAMFQALIAAYSPEQQFDELFCRKLLAMTFLHRFGSLIICERWQVDPPRERLNLQLLGDWLWPGILH
jgi:hypothetical protein